MGTVQFLIGYFTILGIEVQNWMLVAAGVVAVFAIYIWATRDRG
jgi:hypothetical protein